MAASMFVLFTAFYLVLGHAARLVDSQQRPLNPYTPADGSDVIAKLKESSIIPEVVDLFEPQYRLSVNWTSGASAQLGNRIPPAAVQKDPDLLLLSELNHAPHQSVNGPASLVGVLTDPDARSRQDPDWSEVCHWVVYARNTTFEIQAMTIMPYKPPGPPPKTGAHRYVLLALTPSNGTADKLNLTMPADRKHWGYSGVRVGVRRWAKENGLEPIAGSFFYSQHEEQ